MKRHYSLAFLLISILITSLAQADNNEEQWFRYMMGYCEAMEPSQIIVVARGLGLDVATKDVTEKGRIIRTTVILTERRRNQKEEHRFFRGKSRCDAALKDDEKKFHDSIDRYQ